MPGDSTRSNRLGTWVGSVAGVVSAFVAVLAVYRIQFSTAGSLGWIIVCLAEACVIAGLGIWILRMQPVRLPRRIRARNRRMLESLFDSVTDDFRAQVSEIARAQLSLYGRQVRNAQVHLLDALLTQSDPTVRATDIVRRLDLWPTRGVYLRANARFIERGGRTSRIFMVAADLIKNDHDAAAMWDIMESHKKLGVQVSLLVTELLSPEYVEDFVIYSRDCVLVEIEQGDVDFARGKVTVFFDANTTDGYLRKFDYLTRSNDTKSADEIYALYRKYFVDNTPPAKDFAARKAGFLLEAR